MSRFLRLFAPSRRSTTNRPTRSHKRRATSRRAFFEPLEARLPLAAYVWTGAAGTSWDNPSNWDLNNGSIPDDATDTVTLVDVANDAALIGNRTVGALSGNGPLNLGTFTLTVDTATSAAPYSGVLSGTGGLTKQGVGTLTLGGANAYGGPTNVNAGQISVTANTTTLLTPLGTGPVNLAGGTLDVTPVADISAGKQGLSGRQFTGVAVNNTSQVNFAGTAASVRADSTVNISPFSSSTNAIQWVGKINITAAGATTFFVNSDDGSRLFIDGQLVVSNDGTHGTQELSNTVNLSAGLHDIRLEFVNNGGTGLIVLSYTPFGGAKQVIPASVLFQAESNSTAASVNAITLPNAVNLTANSTINLSGTNFTGLGFGSLTPSAGTTLNVTGAAGQNLRFSGTTLGASSTTYTLNATPDIFVGKIVDGSQTGITLAKTGTGRLVLDNTAASANNNDLSGTTLDIFAGKLYVVGSAASGSTNPLSTAAIKLDGGTLTLDSKQNGVTFDNAVTVGASSTIEIVPDGLTTTLGSTSKGITLGSGTTLTLNPFASDSQTAGAVLSLPGVISGNGNLVVVSSTFGANNNPGQVTLTNAGNSYTGTTSVLAGILQVNVNAPSGATGALGNSISAVTLGDPNGNYPVLGFTPTGTATLNTSLSFASAAALDTRNGASAGSTNFEALWTGSLTVSAADFASSPSWTFGTSSDDGSEILIDLNQDGLFSASERVVNNNFSQGATARIGTAIFPAAGTYKIAIGYFQGTGSGSMEARFAKTGGNVAFASQTIINPGAAGQAGLWADDTSTANRLSEKWFNRTPATTDFDPAAFTAARLVTGGAVTVGRNILVLGSSATIGGATGVASTFSGNVNLQNTNLSLTAATSGTINLLGALSGGGGVTQVGAGTVAINNTSATPNNYFGGTVVNGGTLRLDAANQISNLSPVSVTVGSLNLNGNDAAIGSLTMGGGAAGTTSNVTTGAGTLTLGGNVTYSNTNNPGAATISGNLNLGGATRTFTIGDSTAVNPDMIVNGVISNGGLTLAGGVFRMDGTAANTYAGTTTISSGTLILNKSAGVAAIAAGGSIVLGDGTGTDTLLLAKDEQIADDVPFSTNAAGTPVFDLATFDETINLISSANNGAVITGKVGSVLTTGDDAVNTTFSGVLTNSLSLVKQRAATFTLAGTAANSTRGTISVLEGVLALNKTGVAAIVGPLTIGDGLGGQDADEVRLLAGNQIVGAGANVTVRSSGLLNLNGNANTLSAGSSGGSTVTPQVAESGGYFTVYQLDIPTSANFTSSVPYAVNNSASTPAYDRIAYLLELDTGTGLQYAWISMDPFTTQPGQVGVPTLPSGAVFQQAVSNMNVFSNAPGIVTGTALATGNIEFWPYNYAAANTVGIPNASASNYDFGDSNSNSGNYGSMQVHNYDLDGAGSGTAGQTIIAYNHWNSSTAGDLGIGNDPAPVTAGVDWTFHANAASYTVKRLTVLVHPIASQALTLEVGPTSSGHVRLDNGSAGGTLTLGNATASLGGVQVVAAAGTTSASPAAQITGLASSNLALGNVARSIAVADTATPGSGVDLIISAPITGGAAGSLTFDGPGTVQLTGASNIGGQTAVSAGTLALTGSLTGNLDVSTAGTLTGNGSVTGNVTGSGTFAPGNGVGTFTINGNFTPLGTVNFDVNSPYVAAGTDYDQLVVSGNVDLTSATLAFINSDDTTAPAQNSSLKLLSKTAGGSATPSAGLAEGAAVTIGARNFAAYYGGGDGNDLVLVESTTPTTIYVDDGFSGNVGQTIADADQSTPGNQPAVLGVNAFASISAALAAIPAGGTLILSSGTYNETVTLDGSRTLQIGGGSSPQSVTISALESAAGTTIDIKGSSTLTVGDAADHTIAGQIAGSGTLIKAGSGALTLTGSISFPGTTTVSAGKLVVNGSLAGPVGVSGTGTLGGSGSSGEVTVGSTGTLNPGNSPGIYTVNGNLNQNGNLTVEFAGTGTAGAATGYDQTKVVGGGVTIDNVTGTGTGSLTINYTGTPGAFNPTSGQVFKIIDNDGTTDLVVGLFNGRTDGSTVTIDGKSLKLFYNGGDGNDVVLVEAGTTPTTVYVDDAWAGFTPGTVIADGNDGNATAEPAVFGVNAFATPSAGMAAVAASGTVIVNDGTYSTDAVNLASGSGKTLQLTKKAAGTLNSTVTIGSIDSATGTTIALGTNALILSDGDNSAANTLAGALTGGGAGSGLTKQGTDALNITVANTFTAPTTISGGVLSVSNATALGTSAITVGAGTLEIAGVTVANSLLLNNGATLRGTGSATYSASGNPVIASGATVTFATSALADTLNIGSGYANAGGSTVTPTINIAGPGMVALNSGNNAFRGNWNVQSGTLRATANNAFGEPDAAGSLTGSTLTLAGGNLLVRTGADVTFNAGAGNAIPVIVSANASITDQRTTTGAGIDANFGTLSIGSSTLTLSNDASNNSGDVDFRFNGLTTVTGNPTFSITRAVSGTRVLLRHVGGLTDGGVARTITYTNPGPQTAETVVLTGANRTLLASTQIVLAGSQVIRYINEGASATDNSAVRFTNTLATGAIYEMRSDISANFNNSLVLDANADVRVSRLVTGAGVTHTLGNLTVNGARTLLVSGATLTTNDPYGLNLGSATLSGAATLTVNNNGTGLGTLNFSGAIGESAASSLTKSGAGTLLLNGAGTYSGTTTIANGTLKLGIDNALPTAAGLVVGSGTTAGTLDMAGFSQTVGSLASNTNSTTATNSILIASGETLTVNGGVTIGPATNGATTLMNISGQGSLVVASPSATFAIGGSPAGTNNFSKATLDMSGLASFSLNYTAGSVVVGNTGDNSMSTWPSNLVLAADSTIAAPTLTLGNSNNGSLQSLKLGSGTNLLKVDTLNIGTGGRDSGSLTFNTTTGTLTLLNRLANGRTNVNMQTGSAATGYVANNVFDVSGHSANLSINNFIVGGQPRLGAVTNLINFDMGTLDVTTFQLGLRTGSAVTTASQTSTLNIGGGTVTIGTGGLELARNAATGTTANSLTAVVNVTNGIVTIANSATLGAAVRLANNSAAATSGTTANGTLNITGGSVTVAGHIIKGAATAPANTTLTLNGGTLDIAGKNIGGATPIGTLNFQSGTLKNVAQINNGATPLTKSTAGTLVLLGNNTYGGGTVVNDGTLLVNNGAGSGTGSGPVSVNDAAVLGGTGRIAGTVTLNGTATLSPGDSTAVDTIDDLATGDLTLGSGRTFDVRLDSLLAGDYDQLVVTGGVILNGATLNLSGAFAADPATLQSFTLIDNDGSSDLVTGIFNGLSEGSPIAAPGGGTFFITYRGGDGNDVALTSQPLVSGTPGNDRLILRRSADGTQLEYSLSPVSGPASPFIPIGNPTHFSFQGWEGDDQFVLDFVNGNPIPGMGLAGEGIDYFGGTQDALSPGDVFDIEGTGSESVVYTPSSTTPGNGTLMIDGEQFRFAGLEPGNVVNVASFTLVTTNVANNADHITIADGLTAGSLLPALVVSGDSGGAAFENVRLRQVGLITIDAATNDGAGFADFVTIASADNAHLNGSLAIQTGAAADVVNLNGDVRLDGGFSLTGVENVVLGASVTVDTEQGNDGNGGSVNLSGAAVSADAAGRDLTVDTSTTLVGGSGGAVSLGAFGNGGGAFMNDLSLNTAGPAAGGQITLAGDILLDNSGTTDAANLVVTGGGNIVLATSLTIDTEQGNSANITDASSVDFGTSSVSASVSGRNLTIDTSSTTGTSVGGSVSLATFGSADGFNLNNLSITTTGNGPTAGDVTLGGAMDLAGSFDIPVGGSVTANQDITTGGALNWNARQAVALAANANIDAGASTVTILANQDGAGTEGFAMGAGSSIATTNDTAAAVAITVNTSSGGTGNASLDAISAGLTAGRITIDAADGAIVDAQADGLGTLAATTNLTSSQAILTAATGVGTAAEPIETAVANLEAASLADGVFVRDLAGGLTLSGITGGSGVTAAGEVAVTSLGSLTVAANVLADGPVTLTAADALAAGEDLTVASGVTVQSTASSVTLDAGDNLVLNVLSVIDAGTDVALSIDWGVADPLTGSTNTLAGTIQTTSGNITLTSGSEADSFTQTGLITAGGSGDVLIDLGAGNDSYSALASTARIDVGSAADTLTISGGEGSDTISLGNNASAAAVIASVTFLNGNSGDDTFNIRALATTPFVIDGGVPALPNLPGDTLNVDLSTVAAGNTALVLGAGPGDGTYAFLNGEAERFINFNSIETSSAAGGQIHLVLDMAQSGFEDGSADAIDASLIDAQGDSLPDLQLAIGDNPFFTYAQASVLSLTVLGSGDNDTFTVTETSFGLPQFSAQAPAFTVPAVAPYVPSAITSTGAHLNATADSFLDAQVGGAGVSAANVTVYFDGRTGTNGAAFSYRQAHQVQYTSDTLDGANSGNVGVLNAAGNGLQSLLAFAHVTPLMFTGAGGTLIADASSTPNVTGLTIDDNGDSTDGYSTITPSGASNGFETTTFGGFNSLVVRSGTGAETIDLVAIDVNAINGVTLDTSVTLDADNLASTDTAADTIRVRSLPALSGTITLLGGLGSDTFQLYDAANSVHRILGAVVVDGEDGNATGCDQLFVNDSGNAATSDDFVLAADDPTATGNQDYVLRGTLTGFAGTNDVRFRGIDTLTVTASQLDDTIDARLVPTLSAPHDLNSVTLNGSLGRDLFLLYTSDQFGGIDPTTGLLTPGEVSGVTQVFLNGANFAGDTNTADGVDTFGELPPEYSYPGMPGTFVPGTSRGLRPSATTTIMIDGGKPSLANLPAPAAPTTDRQGDIINVDLSGIPNSQILILGNLVASPAVTTLTGGGTAGFSYREIEDVNLIDASPIAPPPGAPVNGVLTNVQTGGFYARGTAGNDQIEFGTTGTATPDSARVGAGATTKPTQYQNFYSITGRAVVYGGGGNDVLRAYSFAKHDMEFYGEDGNDQLAGHSGNDKLVGGRGNDSLQSNGGDDILWGDRDPVEVGLADTVDNRSLLASDVPGPAGPGSTGYHPVGFTYGDVIVSGDGDDVIYAGPGDDGYGAFINAGNGDDVFYGGHGNDNVDGGAGNDRVYGGDGNDVISGNTGDDLVVGNDGNDSLYGKVGNDVLIGGAGNDFLSGDEGNDLLYAGGLQITGGPDPADLGYDDSQSSGDANDLAMAALLADWAANSALAASRTYLNSDPAGSGNTDRLLGGTGNDCRICGPGDQFLDSAERTNPFLP